MADTKKTLKDAFFDAAEELDWHCAIEEYSNGNQIMFEKWSPAGEDFSFSVSDSDDCAAIYREVREYANSFDVDDHVRMWVSAQGHVSGVPSSIRALCDDADAIQEMLDELAGKLYDTYSAYEPNEI